MELGLNHIDIETFRVLNALSVGGVLTFCGLVSQQVTRNNLAEPYISGTAPAALLGYVLGQLLWPQSQIFLPYVFSGVVTVLYAWFLFSGKKSKLSMLMIGILLGGFCLSVANLMVYLFPSSAAQTLLYAALQSKLDAAGPAAGIWLLGAALSVSVLADTVLRNTFLGLQLPEDKAKSLGLLPPLFKGILMSFVAVLTSLITIQYGFLSFIGLIIPNFVRSVLGGTVRFMYVISTVLGGLLLLGLDYVGRGIYPPYGVPVGLITPFLGLPLLLYWVSTDRTAS